MTAALVLTLLLSGPAQAAAPPTPVSEADRILSHWVAAQHPGGYFLDPMRGDTGGRSRSYNEALLGYLLLRRAGATGRQDFLAAGQRAIAWRLGLRGPRSKHPPPNVFENYFLIRAYRLSLASRRLSADTQLRALRPAWRQAMRQSRPVILNRGRRFFNQTLVEAAAYQELGRLRLLSRGERAWAARQVRTHLVSLPHRMAVSHRLGRSALFADPGDHASAYQALIAHWIWRHQRGLRGEDRRRSTVTLRRLTDGLAQMAGPDGDLAYLGRSHQQAWALTLAIGPLAASRRAADRRAALRLWERYLTRHATPSPAGGGMSITPLMARFRGRSKDRALLGALDGYSDVGTYSGLAVLGLLEAARPLQRQLADTRQQPDGVAQGKAAPARLMGGRGHRLALARAPDAWLMARERTGRESDLRYDAGPVKAKLRLPDGSWEDLLADLPRTVGTGRTRGPYLCQDIGRCQVPRFGPLGVGQETIRQTLTYPGPGAHSLQASYRLNPREGLVIALPGYTGPASYSLFVPHPAEMRQLGARSAVVGDLLVGASGPLTPTIEPIVYRNATDGFLTRVDLHLAGGLDGVWWQVRAKG